MKDYNSTYNTSGLFVTLLQVLFIALKLLKKIDWSWWWVWSPTWITTLLGILIVVIVVFWKLKH